MHMRGASRPPACTPLFNRSFCMISSLNMRSRLRLQDILYEASGENQTSNLQKSSIFKLSNFTGFQTFKLSNVQTLKLLNFHTFKLSKFQTFNLSNFQSLNLFSNFQTFLIDIFQTLSFQTFKLWGILSLQHSGTRATQLLGPKSWAT